MLSQSITKQVHNPYLLLSMLGILWCAGANSVHAAAVDELNGKVGVSSGNVDGASTNLLDGSLSFPLMSQDYGMQLDMISGNISQADWHGVGVHGFWREPDRGLLGIVVSTSELGDIATHTVGIESEYYLEQITLGMDIGHLDGDIESAEYYGVGVKYYPIENWSLSLTGYQVNEKDSVAFEVEYLFGNTNLSLFSGVSSGENQMDSFQMGIRYYIGKESTLIYKHRYSDPKNPFISGWAQSDALTQYREENDVGSGGYVPPPPPPPVGSGGPIIPPPPPPPPPPTVPP